MATIETDFQGFFDTIDRNFYGSQECTQFCSIGCLRDNLTGFGEEIRSDLKCVFVFQTRAGRHSHAVNKTVS